MHYYLTTELEKALFCDDHVYLIALYIKYPNPEKNQYSLTPGFADKDSAITYAKDKLQKLKVDYKKDGQGSQQYLLTSSGDKIFNCIANCEIFIEQYANMRMRCDHTDKWCASRCTTTKSVPYSIKEIIGTVSWTDSTYTTITDSILINTEETL